MTELDGRKTNQQAATIGVAQAIAAYLWWGFATGIYFKELAAVSPIELLAWRVLAGLPVMLILLALPPGYQRLRGALGDRRKVGTLVTSTLLISVNWLVFIYAVVNSRLVEASLGYYINPLVSVLLGRIFLGERLGRIQKGAVLLAATGVIIFAWSKFDSISTAIENGTDGGLGWSGLPWISLALPLSFGCYGLLRKQMSADSTTGLAIEMAFLFPFMLFLQVWLMSNGEASFLQGDIGLDVLLFAGGLVTAIPLVLFAAAARRLRLATIGQLQYLAPSCQLLLAVFWFGETIDPMGIVAFIIIWTAVGLYSFDSIRSNRVAAAQRTPE